MARNEPSLSTKGNAKAYGPPTQASPRLAALRARSVPNPQPETPVTPAIIAPTPSLPPKKRSIQKAAGEGTSKAGKMRMWNKILKRVRRRHIRVPEMEEKEEEEDPEEDPEEENAVEEGVREEDDFMDYWALVRSDSEDSVGNDYCFWNYDGDLPNWGNAEPANSSVGSCTGPPPANL
ncbi:hypothetical protein PIB30_046858 [Stylosanthes scabra]|uniref:Uncharacterized protein n=1 Tax=Stylosanthes scabra TaxID=79078 RepID=A0ABU6YFB5_9FABA|nr:hypothetical protein [Stylosanthes scabra]